jgi:hypothetical protein
MQSVEFVPSHEAAVSLGASDLVLAGANQLRPAFEYEDLACAGLSEPPASARDDSAEISLRVGA